MIAGPNEAGKTTIADLWLASRIPVISRTIWSPTKDQSDTGRKSRYSGTKTIIVFQNQFCRGYHFFRKNRT